MDIIYIRRILNFVALYIIASGIFLVYQGNKIKDNKDDKVSKVGKAYIGIGSVQLFLGIMIILQYSEKLHKLSQAHIILTALFLLGSGIYIVNENKKNENKFFMLVGVCNILSSIIVWVKFYPKKHNDNDDYSKEEEMIILGSKNDRIDVEPEDDLKIEDETDDEDAVLLNGRRFSPSLFKKPVRTYKKTLPTEDDMVFV